MNKSSLIEPEYLVSISQQIEILNKFYETQKNQSLSNEYKRVLTKTFSNLYENINLYSSHTDPAIDNAAMIKSSVIKCRTQLQIFCLQKLSELIKNDSPEISQLLENITIMYTNNVQEFETAILLERKQRLIYVENKKDEAIERLKEELIDKKKYIQELKQQIQELEKENSKMYHKMINNAKIAGDRALSVSPQKNIANSPSKIKIDMTLQSSSSHKNLTSKQVEETIFDIMQSKSKQEDLKGKKKNVSSFLKTYFRNKFGMKGLAEETEQIFKEALEFFSEAQDKNIFILFTKVLAEECEEQFFWDQKAFADKCIKIIKRYLNEKDGKNFEELDKIYDSKTIDQRLDIPLNEKDVQCILMNLYKTTEVDSLQMIFNQLMLSHIQIPEEAYSSVRSRREKTIQQNKGPVIPSKKLLNEILNYELKRHELKIEDIIHFIERNDSGRGMMNSEQLKSALFELQIPNEKIEASMDLIYSYQGKFLTYSEFIEVIEKVRKSKQKKR